MAKYAKLYNRQQNPPQTQPLPNRQMVRNSAGGYVFEADIVRRFLILGATGATYYASEQSTFDKSSDALQRAIQKDGVAVVELIREISENNRAPRQSPALFALALAKETGDVETRSTVYDAIASGKVIRTARQLFEFFNYLKAISGKLHVGNGLRKAVSAWYNRDPYTAALQVVKYRSGSIGETKIDHADIMRLSHYKPANEEFQTIRQYALRNASMTQLDPQGQPVSFDWLSDEIPGSKALQLLWAFERVQQAEDLNEVLNLIHDFKLTWELVPNTWLGVNNPNAKKVWEALLPNLPMTALIRNLNKLTATGVLAFGSAWNKVVIDKITDPAELKRGRIHPINALSAQRTYSQGRGERGSLTWNPVPNIVEALEHAFYESFGVIESANKNTMLALDVSGSMGGGEVAGVPGLSPREASAVMAMVSARTEPEYFFFGFSSRFIPLAIRSNMTFDQVLKIISRLPFESTDCSLPFIYARENKLPVDTFVVYTDNETYAGRSHPVRELQAFRQSSGRNARSVVVGMVTNDFTIADPNDGGMLDVVGFDSAAPQLIADFSASRI